MMEQCRTTAAPVIRENVYIITREVCRKILCTFLVLWDMMYLPTNISVFHRYCAPLMTRKTLWMHGKVNRAPTYSDFCPCPN